MGVIMKRQRERAAEKIVNPTYTATEGSPASRRRAETDLHSGRPDVSVVTEKADISTRGNAESRLVVP